MVAIVYTSAAQMPSSCRGQYRNVHVIDVAPELAAKASKEHFRKTVRLEFKNYYWDIYRKTNPRWRPPSINSKEVQRVIWSRLRCNVGTTDRCEYARAIKQAEEICVNYNMTTGEHK